MEQFSNDVSPRRRVTTPRKYSCYEQLISSDEEESFDFPKKRKKKTKSKCDNVSDSHFGNNHSQSSVHENGKPEEIKSGANAFVCEECGKVLRSKDTLHRHQISHSGLKPFLCSICKQGFSSAVSLKEHKARHENKMLYNCKTCSKGFRQNSCYRRHLQIHSKTYTEICNICNRSFSSKDYLRSHMKIHSSVKSYVCDHHQCSKAFARVSDLKRHKILHTGIRPYECTICGSTFADSSSCRRHMRDHSAPTKVQTYSCNECSSSFRKLHLLNQHLLKKHKITKECDTNVSCLPVKDLNSSVREDREEDFSSGNLLLEDGLLHCPELGEALPTAKESINVIEDCVNYLDTGNYNNLLTGESMSSNVYRPLPVEIHVPTIECAEVRQYPDQSVPKTHFIFNEEIFSTHYISFPDFSNQEYYKWLEDFTLLMKMLPYPIDSDLFNKIGQVHKVISDVLANPTDFFFSKSTFAKLRSICQDLEYIKNGHLDFIFEHLQD